MTDQPRTYIDPLHDELDRLRTQLAQVCENYGTDHAAWNDRNDAAEKRADKAEARVNRLMEDRDTYKAAWERAEQWLALANDTLRHRATAVNATGAANDTLRATIARVGELAKVQAMSCQAQHRADHARNWLDVLAIIERSPLADPEPTSE